MAAGAGWRETGHWVSVTWRCAGTWASLENGVWVSVSGDCGVQELQEHSAPASLLPLLIPLIPELLKHP